jgi:hypothetical protein
MDVFPAVYNRKNRVKWTSLKTVARIEDYAINGILNELYVGVLLYV